MIRMADEQLISVMKKSKNTKRLNNSLNFDNGKSVLLCSSSSFVCSIFVCLFVLFSRWCGGAVLTHCSWETPKRLIGKQCRPRSDAAECGI